MDSLGPEWAALVLASKDPRNGEELGEIARLCALPGFDVGELMEQAMRHHLLPRLGMIADELPLPASVRGYLREARRCNQVRIATYRGHAREVARGLDERGIAFVFTKGFVLEPSIYRGEATRRMNDVDLMIAPADREAVRGMFVEAGFTNGAYDWKNDRLVPLDRKSLLTYGLYPDHLPHFKKKIPDVLTPVVTFDVANSLTWHTSEWQLPVEPALASRERFEAGGDSFPRMSWSYSFLFMVFHFFREAFYVDNIGTGHDVNLPRLADIYLAWREHRDEIVAGGLPELIAAHGFERPMAWVLGHIDRALGSTMTAELGLEEHAGEAWLSSLRGETGGRAELAGTMAERLHSRDRRSLVREGARPEPAA